MKSVFGFKTPRGATATCLAILSIVLQVGCKPTTSQQAAQGPGAADAEFERPIADTAPDAMPDETPKLTHDVKKDAQPAQETAKKAETPPEPKPGPKPRSADRERRPSPKRVEPAKVGQERPIAKPDVRGAVAELVPPANLHKPSVLLSDEHLKTCHKQIGDTMPTISLPDLDAKDQTLPKANGDHYTVVVFWSMRQSLGREQFRRLQTETVEPFQSNGLDVVAVNVGDDPEEVRKAYQEAKATFPCLIDRNKLAFTSLATELLPRTYLLGPDGRILWLDLVYSRTTRRELSNAIHYFSLERKKSKRSG